MFANQEFYATFARMLPRRLYSHLRELLSEYPAVGLIGPRQVGKTTLAWQIADGMDSVYLDLESPSDLAKLGDLAGELHRAT
ncbi:MAG: hypothetical protein F4X70_03060 [Acidimicrobiia bacterium]|nr:hypothetical protein [Acidimicrobiia bacterium]